MSFLVTIGLEVHCQVKTETKMFCGCRTSFGSTPNTHTCPVCLGMPGVLPVLNKKVVAYAMRMAKLGIAVLVSEQVLSFAMEVADDILVLDLGRIVRSATKNSVDIEEVRSYLTV
jgi:hypothetical protein